MSRTLPVIRATPFFDGMRRNTDFGCSTKAFLYQVNACLTKLISWLQRSVNSVAKGLWSRTNSSDTGAHTQAQRRSPADIATERSRTTPTGPFTSGHTVSRWLNPKSNTWSCTKIVCVVFLVVHVLPQARAVIRNAVVGSQAHRRLGPPLWKKSPQGCSPKLHASLRTHRLTLEMQC